jgi:iron(III) transport system substrate-binding protein
MQIKRRALGTALLGIAAPQMATGAPAKRKVTVLAATDRIAVQPLIEDFELRYPDHQVDYRESGSVDLYRHFLSEGGKAVDVLWSSAMDLQIKLVNDGHALRYESPHVPNLPRWAVWNHEAYGTTYEPVGIAYQRQQLAAHEVPRTHAALVALLRSDTQRFRGRVATYDIERAGIGFLLAAQDAVATPLFWELVRALGACRANLHADTRSMLESVAAGRSLVSYNVLGTYAEAFARGNPDVGVVYPSDYTLVLSRVAFIARHAQNPQGARLWLDHLLSPQGQRLLAGAGGLFSVRTDSAQPRSALAVGQQLGAAARPIALGPALLAHLDRSKHAALLKRWHKAFDHTR